MSDRSTDGVVVVGGGLVGSLLSVFLARRGFRVDLYERREDPRANPDQGGRSINLIVTSRGIAALARVGLAEAVLEFTVPVLGRMMHSHGGGLAFQPYGRTRSECNHSVSRGELNRFLLDEAERRGVRLHFGRILLDADPGFEQLQFADEDGGSRQTVTAPVVFGADGAGSAVRAAMVGSGRVTESVEMLSHGYKELEIPAGADGKFRVRGDALHIWPRGESMLMALPNRDGSFTVTLYLRREGHESFQEVAGAEAAAALFRRHFPDAVPLIPGLETDYPANPTGLLGTVRCEPWNVDGRALLIGDAAHGVVPFFGQGMNCGFEDCLVLDDLFERGGSDWASLFDAFSELRKPDADAIADMALDNFVEMRDRVGDPAFLLRKQVEHQLERLWPREYRSRYSMVVYSLIPYRIAQQAGEIQDGILAELCKDLPRVEELDMSRARRLIQDRLAPFLTEREVSLDY